ncbi:MAG: metal-dependent transcriptional regulator [Solobacterium sp.]|jgi:Mn-dependent DtxR family transcriptional regulator|nr:metal-dependent transcriptional regulator [Solobacterium sp.]MCH4223303.1 metal-dependent transcriptional regulator [Solobacterium sp.]
MQIYESAEDYLETILMIQERKGVVHSVDIAAEKEYSKASVSIAMKKLRENGYINMDPSGVITLLPPGRKIAERIYERHRILSSLFIHLGVSPKTAQEDACKVEHDLSVETFSKIKKFADQLENKK